MPEGVCIKKYITLEEYLTHLVDVVADAKTNHMNSGTNAGAPTRIQQEDMARILNADGYSSIKWIGLVRGKKSAAKVQDIDGEDDAIGEIMRRMYVRKAAKNKELMCCINQEGHCTKTFSTRIELARHIYGKYGLAWERNIRVIDNGEEMIPLSKKVRVNEAPDLAGMYDVIGMLYVGLQRYMVHNAPRDGSCFYHSFSSMRQPILKEETPSARAIKEILREFYKRNDTPLKRSLESLLSCSFVDRYRDIGNPGHWEHYNDTLCLASIYKIKFKIATVQRMRVVHSEEVVGRKKNGYRLSHTQKCNNDS